MIIISLYSRCMCYCRCSDVLARRFWPGIYVRYWLGRSGLDVLARTFWPGRFGPNVLARTFWPGRFGLVVYQYILYWSKYNLSRY